MSLIDFSSLNGRNCLITGAASGIGKETALALSSAGVRVTCVDITPPAATVSEISDGGGTAIGAAADISDDLSVKAAVAAHIDAYGSLDALVNCAGIGDFTTLDETDLAYWNRQISINLTGPFLLVKHAVPVMRERKTGSIILFGSIAGKTGGIKNGPAYAAAKAGVHGLVKWTAKSIAGSGVRVNGIAPGPVDTPFTKGQGFDPSSVPLGRMGLPADFASAVAYLASDASSWVTGQVLNINGGLFME